MAKSAAQSAQSIDPRSDAVVLRYLGSEAGEPALIGIPARDLTAGDVARLVYASALNAWAGDPETAGPDPTAPDQAACAALIDLLVSRGLYSTDVPAVSTPAPSTEG
jgi:hypothetical protein